jgi:hypothetical protein
MAQASMQQGSAVDVREILAVASLDPYRDGLLPEVWKINDASL